MGLMAQESIINLAFASCHSNQPNALPVAERERETTFDYAIYTDLVKIIRFRARKMNELGRSTIQREKFTLKAFEAMEAFSKVFESIIQVNRKFKYRPHSLNFEVDTVQIRKFAIRLHV